MKHSTKFKLLRTNGARNTKQMVKMAAAQQKISNMIREQTIHRTGTKEQGRETRNTLQTCFPTKLIAL
jgi:hypothetical protein